MQPVLRQQGPVAIINHSNYKIMQKNRHCHRVGRYRWHKFGRIMKLCLILVCVFSFGLSATTKAQQERVSLKLENVSLKILLDKIQEQTQLNFMVNREQAKLLGLVSVNVQDETVENVLNRVLSNSKLTYVFMDEIIVIKVRQPEEKDKKEKYVRCERSYGVYSREFDLTGIRADEIHAKYENGVLKLTLPKLTETKPEARRLEIE